MYCSWGVYHYQFESLPVPLTADQAGKRGFAEFSALKHVKALTQLGPHPLGFDAITLAQQVLTSYFKIEFYKLPSFRLVELL
jgi:hypothetical protein